MSRVYIKPAFPGTVIRDPENFHRIIPPEGANVEFGGFMQRRVRDADAVICEDPETVKPTPNTPPATPAVTAAVAEARKDQ
jgi:hypothetical protein